MYRGFDLRNKRDNASQKGISSLELVIILPLLVILSTGLIDLGIMLRSHRVLAGAVRTGGFRASRIQIAPTARLNCGAAATIFKCEKFSTKVSVGIKANGAKAVCNSLALNGLNKEDFNVEARIVGRKINLNSVSVRVPYIHLKTFLKPGHKACTICLGTKYINTNMIGKKFLNEKASYALIGKCA